MAEFTIETGIEVPSVQRGKRKEKYPFAQLEVGQSFKLPEGSVKASTIGSLVNNANKRHAPAKFVYRAVEGGHRIWRTEDVAPGNE